MTGIDFDLLDEALGIPKKKSTPTQPTDATFPKVSRDQQLERDRERAATLMRERQSVMQLLSNASLTGDDRLREEANLKALEREIGTLPAELRQTQVPSASSFPELDEALGMPAAPVVAPAAAAKPAAPAAPAIDAGRPAQKLIESVGPVPGTKEFETFGKSAGGTISKSFSAVQQLVGKYFPGLDEETRNAILSNAQKNIGAVEAAMEPGKKESPKAAIAGEIAGYVTSPVSKLVPSFGAATTLAGAGTKGFMQGAVAEPLMQPVTDENAPFATEKLKQAATGGLFGFGGGVALQQLSTTGGKVIDSIRRQFNNVVPDAQLEQAANSVLKSSGITADNVSKEFFKGLQDQAKAALKTGDVKSFQNFAKNFREAEEEGIPMLRGQLTRDPMQFAVEQNLRGIQGVGEPIQKVLTEQTRAMIARLNELGAGKGESITTSGFTLRNALKKADEAEVQKVRDAYTAYKNSTGKDINVPLQNVAQDYAKVLRDFGADQIPSGVRNNFESLGILTGTQKKVTTIEDAENLIKLINRNYDPAKQPKGTINALDDLRNSLNKAINDAGANLPGQAGKAAREARAAASARFDTINEIPALKSVIRGKEPDKFVQNHILQGNVEEIAKMRDYLAKHNPEALAQVQNDVLRHIKDKTIKNVGEENAHFVQGSFKDFVSGPMADRLKRFLTPEQFNKLAKLNRIAENAFVEPVGAALNRSNTASAAANFVKSTVQTGEINNLLSTIAGYKFPIITGAATTIQQRLQSKAAANLLREATEPTIPKAAPAGVSLADFVKPGVAGAGAGRAAVEQRNLEMERR
jgi:hypothetical protein